MTLVQSGVDGPPGVRLLLVEDNPGDARLLREEFSNAAGRFEVTHATRLSDGLSLLDQTPFDVVLLDLYLPDSRGFATFEAAALHAKGIPIVVLSGLSDESVGAQAVQHGAQDYLVKGQIPSGLLERTICYALERSKSSDALRDSEERYRQFFEEDLTGAFIATPEGDILACNPAFARMFGFESIEAARRQRVGLYFPRVEDAVEMRDTIRRERKLVNHEFVLQRRDRKPVHTIGNLIGAFGPDGELTEIKGYLLDDTERRRLEEDLRQSQKLESIGRLAGGVAHDFNNLLTVILGYADTVIEQLEVDDPRRGDVEEIRNAGNRAATLTQQLLAFSRRQVLQFRVLDLGKVVGNVERMLKRTLGENVRLETRFSSDTGRVRADAAQIEQVVLNLCLNARDAMPSGGTLTIETMPSRVTSGRAESRSGVPAGDYMMLSVADTGHGIDPDLLPHLFEPFVTTKRLGKGTGLGLATVYGIVKQSNGEIAVETEVGRGTTFRIYLPLSSDSPTPDEKAIPVSDDSGTERILLVEDEIGVRAVASRLLRSKGYSILEAESGAEALELCRREPGSVDLLITDLVMPGMNGRDLAERIRVLQPGIPVLFMSGYTADHQIRSQIESRGAAFLQKPFETSALARAARRLLDAPVPLGTGNEDLPALTRLRSDAQ